jgi:hypothetical protein
MISTPSLEDSMARTGAAPSEKSVDPATEPEVDFMAEAPPARPYSEAITEAHRELLAINGVDVSA